MALLAAFFRERDMDGSLNACVLKPISQPRSCALQIVYGLRVAMGLPLV